jgi:hypothetical protein
VGDALRFVRKGAAWHIVLVAEETLRDTGRSMLRAY